MQVKKHLEKNHPPQSSHKSIDRKANTTKIKNKTKHKTHHRNFFIYKTTPKHKAKPNKIIKVKNQTLKKHPQKTTKRIKRIKFFIQLQ
jgi:hypothetical protein